jgi:RIO kinase 1
VPEEKLLSYTDSPDDRYADYESRFDPARTDRKARRKRNPSASRKQRGYSDALDQVAPSDKLELGVATTYQPGRFETDWLFEALQDFFAQSLITDVLSSVKGGKEASVYLCRAHPATGHALLAAKVYRPRMFRNLRNDALYREGRETLTGDGRPVKATDQRIMRALNKKTSFGQAVAHNSWLLHEFTALKALHGAGVNVPQPVAVSANAVLMGFVGDEHYAAPPLESVELDRDEAEELFNQVIRDVETMLAHGIVHGDLSAYNLLYWDGRAVLIDFPQVIRTGGNSSASLILRRDLQRVCEYFAEQGVARDAAALHAALWKRWAEPRADWIAADLSRWDTETDEE